MLSHRVIPALLLDQGGLVKTQRFKQPKYVGDPINAVKIFNDKEVDELVVLDISASRLNKEPDYELISQFASECFMPLAYGGGIRTIEQARTLFTLGVEKVVLQSAVLSDTSLITRVAERFGVQSVVVSLDIKRNWRGKPMPWASRDRKKIAENWTVLAKRLIAAGAGEILLNAVDRDGMQQGYDLELISDLSRQIDVPLIALGGAGTIQDLKSAVDAGASAAAAGSLFVFQGPHRAVLISYPRYAELEALFGNR